MTGPSVQRLLLSDRELGLSGRSDLAARARALLCRQKETWPLLHDGYESLRRVETRTIRIDDFDLLVQWNPARLASSAAAVDAESVRNRPCFLCPAVLPVEQRGVLFAGDYLVLCNPFPVFNEHFTVACTSHTPQRLGPALGALLDLCRAMQDRYALLYNGPRSGASAPDHLHFQAGEKGFLPFGEAVGSLSTGGELLARGNALEAFALEAQLRRCIVVRSGERGSLLAAMQLIEAAMGEVMGGSDEPMMNVLAWSAGNRWTLVVYPRERHRPSFYFAEGDERILLSPGAIDLGGVLITPLERDFRRLTADHVRRMFSEIALSAGTFRTLSERLRAVLSSP